MKLRKATSYEQFQWMRFLCNPDDPGLVLRYQLKLVWNIDFEHLNRTLRKVILNKFSCLSSYFIEKDNNLFVGINPLPDVVVKQVYEEGLLNEFKLINPKEDRLFRLTHFVKDTKISLLNLEFSHLVFDGECYKSFIKLLSIYWRDESAPIYTDMEKSFEPSPEKSSLSFWIDYLKDSRLFQNLPFCYKTPRLKKGFLSVKKSVKGMDLSKINTLTKKYNTTLFQFIVAVTAAVVSIYENQDEDKEQIVVSHTVNCRAKGQPFGCYTNIIPLFINVDKSRSASNLLVEVKKARTAVRGHQFIPTQQLIQMADAVINHGGRLFNLLVNCSSGLIPYDVPELVDTSVEWVNKPETGGPSDLAIHYSCDGNTLYISFDSSACYMSQETLIGFSENFLKMAEFMVSKPEIPLSVCNFSQSQNPVIRGTSCSKIFTKDIIEKFISTAKYHASKIAVIDAQNSLTFQQVLNAVQNIHSEILESGSVGVFIERSVALPIIYMGALLAKKTFIPLDPLLPDERLSYMSDISDINILFVDHTTKKRAINLFPKMEIIEIDQSININWVTKNDLLKPAPVQQFASERIAYVIFTSGSTGKPKGVAISENNLSNFLWSMETVPGFTAEDHILALTPISFDISILELLLPLVCGGSVCIISDKVRISASRLGEAINQSKASVVQATPSTWRILQKSGWGAKHPFTVLCGGEILESDLAEYLLQQTGLLYNVYGPTEATIWASCCRVTDAKHIPIGQPVLNSDFYILDDSGKSVSAGMQGELVIAGTCVGLGYLNTSSEHVFTTLADGTKAYKTGDIVRYLSPQDIEYVCRRDNQYKINGYRVDTGEINDRLKEFEPAATIFTVVRMKPEPHLCSFLWLPEDMNFVEEEAAAWCKRMLPYYMVPKVLCRLSRIPLTANGKVNVKLMSEAALTDFTLKSVAQHKRQKQPNNDVPVSGVHLTLQQILKKKLNVTVIDFEQPLGWLGLNSISYNLLSAELKQHFDIVLHSYEFYQFNTLNEVAGVISQRMSFSEHGVNTEKTKNYCHSMNHLNTQLAIIGMSVIMPGGKEVDDFWKALLNKEDSISSSPQYRNLLGCYAGFLPDIMNFDARFFCISPLEAACMDPRQRLLMQATWRAIEDAGYAPAELAGGPTGCYIAATGIDYALLQAREGKKQIPYSLPGHSLSMLSNRISSYFDWKGPSFTLDTACSGTLVALVKACRDLQTRCCDLAMVGGINLILDPQINQGLLAGGFMSPDHRCATFDEKANGYVRGEGYGCFLIKRLEDAVADDDCIYAVIESAVENHGGKANSLTAPNPNAQYRLLLDAYTSELARQVSYIETHGTGTRLGDPIEIAALKCAWRDLVDLGDSQPVWLGAVKSNIGHLEPAAGVASVAKVIKAFEYNTLPSNLHFRKLNPEIDLAASPFRVLEETIPWHADGKLVAGVSSFGFGGSNAHVVLSAPPNATATRPPSYRCYLALLSARTEAALLKNIVALSDFIEHYQSEFEERDLLNLVYTMSCGRNHFECRQAWLVTGIDELLSKLRDCRNGTHTPKHQLIKDDEIQYGKLSDHNMLEQVKALYLRGGNINWRRLYHASGAKRMRFPTYRFDEQKYWFSKEKLS